MKNWKDDDVINWLLEDDNPSVKYFTLVDLLEKDDSETLKVKEQIMKIGPVPKILEKQNPKGYWGAPEDFYIRSKYKGTVWSFILLAELGADGGDKRIRKAYDFIIKNSQVSENGGFAHYSSSKGGGVPSKVIPCLTENMIYSMIRFGYFDEPAVQKGINWITTYQRFDDGVQNLPEAWPYKAQKACFSKHSCHMGCAKALKALSEIPKEKRTNEVNYTLSQGVEYFLKHHIYKKSHDLTKISKPGWLQLSFPHMYQTDILEILDILTKLDIKDKRMKDAMEIVSSKQNKDGKWILENTFNGKFQTNIEQKGKPSKWITLNALRVLKRYQI